MATKPTPRRTSTLAGAHPVDERPATTSPTSRPAASGGAPATTTHARQAITTKFSAAVDIDVLDAAKDAFWIARNAGRYRVLGDLVTEALREKITALRQELNNGEAFPHRPVENLPPGRVVL
jgi:hypothetical protein